MLRPDGRVRAVETTAGLAMARTPRRRRAPGRAARRASAAAAARAAAKSACRSSRSSSPTETRSRPGVIPAAEQLGLGRLAMRGRRRVDDHRVDAPERGGQFGERQCVDDRPAGGAATVDLEGHHPAGDAGPELAQRDVVLGMARQTRVEDGTHAVLTLEPGRECRGRGGVALDPDGQGQDPAQDEERLERTERRAGVDLDALDGGDELPVDRPRPRR